MAHIGEIHDREGGGRGDMKSEILYPGAFPMVRIELAAGEHIKAESGAMVASSPTVDVESKMEGGFLGPSRANCSPVKSFSSKPCAPPVGPAKCYWPPPCRVKSSSSS